MKLRRVILCAIAIVSAVRAAESPIEFSGVLTADGKTRVALTDKATKNTSWVGLGGQFGGYTVTRYDAKEDAVVLTKGGRETKLSLVTARQSDEPRPATTNNKAATAAVPTTLAVRANLRQLVTAARQYQLEHGVTEVAFTDLVGPDKLIKELKPVAGENYSTLSFGPNVTAVSVTTDSGTTVSFDVPPATAIPPTASIAAQTSPPPPPASGTASPPANTPAAPPPAPPVASSPPPAPEPALEPTGRQPASPSYVIQGNDTWQKISESTGVPVQQLKQLNPIIPEGAPLPAGQTIRVH